MKKGSVLVEAGIVLLCLALAGIALWYYMGHRPMGEGLPHIPPATTSSVPATPPPAATSSVPANCPAWVNCMPGPDVSKTCVIPPGCERYTQKAY